MSVYRIRFSNSKILAFCNTSSPLLQHWNLVMESRKVLHCSLDWFIRARNLICALLRQSVISSTTACAGMRNEPTFNPVEASVSPFNQKCSKWLFSRTTKIYKNGLADLSISFTTQNTAIHDLFSLLQLFLKKAHCKRLLIGISSLLSVQILPATCSGLALYCCVAS